MHTPHPADRLGYGADAIASITGDGIVWIHAKLEEARAERSARK